MLVNSTLCIWLHTSTYLLLTCYVEILIKIGILDQTFTFLCCTYNLKSTSKDTKTTFSEKVAINFIIKEIWVTNRNSWQSIWGRFNKICTLTQLIGFFSCCFFIKDLRVVHNQDKHGQNWKITDFWCIKCSIWVSDLFQSFQMC